VIKSGLDDAQRETEVVSKGSLGGYKSGVDVTLKQDNTVIPSTLSPPVNDEPTKAIYIGEINPSSDAEVPAKRQKMSFDTNWTEILPGDYLDHAHSYEARVLVKEVTEVNDHLYEELIENCPEEGTIKSEIISETHSSLLLNESG